MTLVPDASSKPRLLERLLCGALVVAAGAALASGCLEPRKQPPYSTETRCASCHGDPDRSGDYLIKSAPPKNLMQESDPSYPGIGAHQIHLNDGDTHLAFACKECHIIPETVSSPGHADDDRPAEVVFGELSKTGGRDPSYNDKTRRCSDTYCHRGADAVWTKPRSSTEACGTCHDLPPASPHPQDENCSHCHSQVVDEDLNIVAKELHVNGEVEYEAPACNTCHGDETSDAPPLDLDGNRSPTAIGVGAHRVHLGGGENGRPLACAECHRVPERTDSPAHADSDRPAGANAVAASHRSCRC